mgnify:CR=1 FL=1
MSGTAKKTGRILRNDTPSLSLLFGIELPFEFPQAPIRVFRLNFVEFPFIGIIDTHQEQVMGPAQDELVRHRLTNLISQIEIPHLLQVRHRKSLTIICSKSSRNTIFR